MREPFLRGAVRYPLRSPMRPFLARPDRLPEASANDSRPTARGIA